MEITQSEGWGSTGADACTSISPVREQTRLGFYCENETLLRTMEAEMGLCDHKDMISWECREMFCTVQRTPYEVDREFV